MEYNITDKIFTIITDNASTMKCTAKHFGRHHLPCFAHTLNLVVKDAMKQTNSSQSAVSKISNLTTLMKQSTKVSEKLTKIQERLGIKPKKNIKDVDTWWNSVFAMLERAVWLKDAITLLLNDQDVSPTFDLLTNEDWTVIEDGVAVLQPCYEATTVLAGELFVTGSKALAMSKVLISFYADKH